MNIVEENLNYKDILTKLEKYMFISDNTTNIKDDKMPFINEKIQHVYTNN